MSLYNALHMYTCRRIEHVMLSVEQSLMLMLMFQAVYAAVY
jgi:hypothetical protein